MEERNETHEAILDLKSGVHDEIALVFCQSDYELLSMWERKQLRRLCWKMNVERNENGRQYLSDQTKAVNDKLEQINESGDDMGNLNSNQKIMAYEEYIRAKGDDPKDVLYGRDDPEQGESKDMKAKDAIEVISSMDDAESIGSYIQGEERKTVLEAAKERVDELLK